MRAWGAAVAARFYAGPLRGATAAARTSLRDTAPPGELAERQRAFGVRWLATALGWAGGLG